MRMQNSGIIITVPPKRVSFFLRAGYRKLDDEVEEEPKAAKKGAKDEQPKDGRPDVAADKKPKEWVNPLAKKKGGK